MLALEKHERNMGVIESKNKGMGGFGLMAAGAGAQALGTLGGMALGKWQDKRQLKQAEKLQGLQLKGQEAMGKVNNKRSMELWNKTNAGAQVKHLKDAGLNVGLMYGSGGAGGATAGASAGSVGGQSAGSEQSSTGMGMNMGRGLIEAKLAKSQIDLQDSQAAKNRADTVKTGEDTTGSMLSNDWQEVQNEIARDQSKLLTDELKAKIEKVQQEKLNLEIDAKFKEAGIEKTEAETEAISQKILQTWKSLEYEGKKVELTKEGLLLEGRKVDAIEYGNIIKTFEAKVKANTPSILNTTGGLLQSFIGNSMELLGIDDKLRYNFDDSQAPRK